MADYSINACRESVQMWVEVFHKDPIRLLGEYTLRAKQDVLFNKTMITALEEYIDEHNIRWNS